MGDHQKADALASEFSRAVTEDSSVGLDRFLNLAPPALQSMVCGQLIEIAFTVRCGKGESPWIDDYLSSNIWPHRREICRVLSRLLFDDDDGAMAQQLGLLHFGPFRAAELCGFGGFGAVLKAVGKHGVKIAVKIAHRRPAEAVEMLEKEAAALKEIGVLRLLGVPAGPFELVGNKGWRGLKQDWVEGRPVDCWLAQKRPPTLEDRFEAGRQICRIVADLHQHSWQHGDLSLANILVSQEPACLKIHLVDFANASGGFSARRFPAITGRYAAPELLRNPKQPTSAATDLFSLGVLLYELFAGVHPFGDLSAVATAESLAEHFESGLKGTPAPVIPSELWEVLRRSMNKSPSVRLSAKADIILSKIPDVGDHPPRSPVFWHPPRRQLSLIAIASLAVAVLTAIFVWSTNRHDWPNSVSATLPATLGPPLTEERPGKTAPPSTVPSTRPVLAEEISHDFLGMKLRLIHPGKYLMGSPDNELGEDGKHHPDEWQGCVELTRPLYIGETDVTRGMFKVFVADDHYVTEAERDTGKYGAAAPWLNPGIWQDDRHPVVEVSWYDAVAFTNWLSHKTGRRHRLPLEAEWEYACRAGTTTPYSTGLKLDPLYANFMPQPGGTANPNGSGIGSTTPCGAMLPNPWGLYDMHGNVWQWCLDDHYPGTQPGPLASPSDTAPTGNAKNLRGGGWSHQAIQARSANRWGVWPGYHEKDVGFRVVMEP